MKAGEIYAFALYDEWAIFRIDSLYAGYLEAEIIACAEPSKINGVWVGARIYHHVDGAWMRNSYPVGSPGAGGEV